MLYDALAMRFQEFKVRRNPRCPMCGGNRLRPMGLGVEAVEDILRGDGLLPEGISLYAPTQISVLHHVTQALRAHKLFARDVDYIVKDGQVVIIDEFTGRMRSSARTRPWPRSLSRTCSACIPSWPA